MNSSTRRMVALAAALLATAGAAQAQGKGHGKGHGQGQGQGQGNGKAEDRRDERRDERRDDRGGLVVDRQDRVPPGLAKKPGGMPPGQYKKRYGTNDGASILTEVLGQRGYTVVRTTPAGRSQYVFYRGTDGRVRRAIVSPGAERLTFRNVPASLLQEVLSRLY